MTPAPDPAERRRGLVTRAFVVHLVAYGVALPWAIAMLPIVFGWKEAELLAMADETDAALRVVRWSLVPTALVCVLAHLPGLPWILAARRGASDGKKLYLGSTAALILAGMVTAAISWSRLLGF